MFDMCEICAVAKKKRQNIFLLPFARANKNKIRLDLKTGDLHVKNNF